MKKPISFLYQPLWLPLAAMVWLVTALGLVLFLSWSNLDRLEPVRGHLAHLRKVEAGLLDVEDTLLNHDVSAVKPEEVRRIRQHLGELIAFDGYMVSESPAQLNQAYTALGAPGIEPRRAVTTALQALRAVLSQEGLAQQRALAQVQEDTVFEFWMMLTAILALTVLAAVTVFLARNRVLMPLRDLARLLTSLGDQNYAQVPTRPDDPVLGRVFANYNTLVTRLMKLESAHAERRLSLEQQVRAAAAALLEQQRILARAERLAAVGEVAAGIAHELRNPLAGVDMALQNLRHETLDPDHRERLDMIIAELHRVSSLLTGMLAGARHQPEPPMPFKLADAANELLAVARYQIPERIALDLGIGDAIVCRLPPEQTRQALLNLVLNAAQAIGDHDGAISIKATRDGEILTITVADTGPGFPAFVLESNGKPFVTGRSDGTGLGLAMVRRLARDVGGELTLSNPPEGGARVVLRLPCRASDV